MMNKFAKVSSEMESWPTDEFFFNLKNRLKNLENFMKLKEFFYSFSANLILTEVRALKLKRKAKQLEKINHTYLLTKIYQSILNLRKLVIREEEKLLSSKLKKEVGIEDIVELNQI